MLKNQSYTENKQTIMSKDEDRKCGQVAELFRPFLEEIPNFLFEETERMAEK